MENNAKTREPLDDDALDAVAGGVFKADKPVPAYEGYCDKPAGGFTGYAPPQGGSGGWRCSQCGWTYSAMKPDKCGNCGGEWIRAL